MNTTTFNLQGTARNTDTSGSRTNLVQAVAAVWHALVPQRAAAPTDTRRDVRRARDLASRWTHSDPRSAADLSAAIDRYEAQNGL